MCYSATSSIQSYFSTLSLVLLMLLYYGLYSIYLLWHILFIATFSQIQLIEYFIWSSIYENNTSRNIYWTSIIPALLWMQPLVQTLGHLMVAENTIVPSILVIYYLYKAIQSFSVRPHLMSHIGTYGHLVWGHHFTFWQSLLYLYGMFAPLLLTRQYTLFMYGLISLVYIRFKYPIQEFSSMWCFVAIGYTILLVPLSLYM